MPFCSQRLPVGELVRMTARGAVAAEVLNHRELEVLNHQFTLQSRCKDSNVDDPAGRVEVLDVDGGGVRS